MMDDLWRLSALSFGLGCVSLWTAGSHMGDVLKIFDGKKRSSMKEESKVCR